MARFASNAHLRGQNVIPRAERNRPRRMALEAAQGGGSGIERAKAKVLAAAVSGRRRHGFCGGIVIRARCTNPDPG